MFKKLSNFFKSQPNKVVAKPVSHSNPLFDRFPLSAEDKTFVKNKMHDLLEQIFGENSKKLLNYHPQYPVLKKQESNLIFDTLGWKKIEEEVEKTSFQHETGDWLSLEVIPPNGQLNKNRNELEVYRNWVRELFVEVGGGLISCEEFINSKGVEGSVTIGKVPRTETTGIDYMLYLNIRDYERNLLYQIWLKTHEQGMTGIRDNVLMHPLCDLTNMDMGQIFKVYRQDPYDKNYTKGNLRNASEMKDLDNIIPFHPLSIIRLFIKDRLIKSLEIVR